MPTLDLLPYFVGSGAAAAGSTTIVINIGANGGWPVHPGDTVVVSGGAGSAIPTGVSDSRGYTYTQSPGSSATAPAAWQWTAVATNGLCTNNPSTGLPDTLTVTYSGTAAAKQVIIIACAGILTATPVDAGSPNHASGSSAAPSVASGTLGGAGFGELAVAVLVNSNAGGSPPVWAPGWKPLAQGVTSGSNPFASVAVQVVTGTAPVTASASIPVSSTWSMCILALTPATVPQKDLIGYSTWPSEYPGSATRTAAATTADGFTGRKMARQVQRTYWTEASWPSSADLTDPGTANKQAFGELSDNNIFQVITLRPLRAIGGGTSGELANLTTALLLLKNFIASKGAGNAKFSVILWHECNNWGAFGPFGDGSQQNPNFLPSPYGTSTADKAAQNYHDYAAYYGPTVQAAGIPLVYCPAVLSPAAAITFFPGRALANEYMIDYYATGDYTHNNRTLAQSIQQASGTLPGYLFSVPLPYGLGEVGFNNGPAGSGHPTDAEFTDFMRNQIVAPLQGIITSGGYLTKQTWFALGINDIKASTPASRVADIQFWYDQLNPSVGPVITPPFTLPEAFTGVAVSDTLAATGGTGSYTWALAAGSTPLPPGLSLSSAGVVTGTPTTPGLYTFNIKVTDSANNFATGLFTLQVASAVSITTTALPGVIIGSSYTQTVSVSGGTSPYAFSITAGLLPPGLSMSAGGVTAAVITGVPTTLGVFTFNVTVTDSAGLTDAQTLSITVAGITASTATADSLVVAGMFELLNNRAISTLPQCPGAQFMLVPGYDLSAPQPSTDVVASMLLNGERPYGRRFTNRTVTLPIVIQAPDRATLAAARETLLETIDQQAFSLVWTRQNALPLIFDCFRALPATVIYSTKSEKSGGLPTSALAISFPALPFGHSDVAQNLQFPAPVTGTPAPPPPVLIDDFTSLNTAIQPGWWSQTKVVAVDMFSVHWDWDDSSQDTCPIYANKLQAPVNITGLTALSFWFGLGTENYNKWHKGNVTFSFTLTDTSGNVLSFGATIYCNASNSTSSPQWNQIAVAIPQNTPGFSYSNIVSYSIQAYRMVDNDGDLELDSDVYLNGLFAVPSVSGTPPPSVRGIVYTLNAVVGTAPAPLNLQLQQAAVVTPQSQTFTTPGPFTFTPPAGAAALSVQKWAGAGAGASMTAAGLGGGAKAGEYSANPNFVCTPGVPVNGFVGAGGGASGGFVQRVASGTLSSTSSKTVTGNVKAITTGGQTLLVHIGFGIGGGSVKTVTDTAGNTYAKDYSAPTGTTGSRALEVWRCASASALKLTDVITVTLTQSQSNGAAFICDQYVPLGTPDVTNFAFSSSSVSGIAPNATMLATDGVAVAVACVYGTQEGTAVAGPYTLSGGVVDGGNNSHGLEIAAAYKNAPGAGSSTATFSWSPTHTCVSVILGYPVLTSGSLNGQDTWFGADDSTAAHGGLGVALNSSAGATAQTGTSTDAIVFAGGNGASGATTGGGGGEAGGPSGVGNPGADPAGGSGNPNAGNGGNGAAAGGNNAGSAGIAPGGAGGGAVSVGGAAAGGAGAAGQVTLAWTGTLVPFKTCLVHRPGLDAPMLLSPLVAVGNGQDVPNGSTEYPVVSQIAGQNARFGGTYTVVAVNYSWHTPTVARNVSVTVKQYEYPGGPVVSLSTVPLSVQPNIYDIMNRATPSGNGFVVLGELTLPIRDLADDQTAAYFTVTVTSSDTADRFLDVMFLDTQGQTILIDLNVTTGYNNYWLDAPDPNSDLGHLIGSTYDRSQAVSILDSTIWAGGPLSVVPGSNPVLVYAVEGQPALLASYTPYWFLDRLA